MYDALQNYHNMLRMARPAGWPNTQMYGPTMDNLGVMGGAPGTPWHSQPAVPQTLARGRSSSGYGMTRRSYTRPRSRPWPQPGNQPSAYTRPATWYDAMPQATRVLPTPSPTRPNVHIVPPREWGSWIPPGRPNIGGSSSPYPFSQVYGNWR